jgi:hypothetical protein
VGGRKSPIHRTKILPVINVRFCLFRVELERSFPPVGDAALAKFVCPDSRPSPPLSFTIVCSRLDLIWEPVCGFLHMRPLPDVRTYNPVLCRRQWKRSVVSALTIAVITVERGSVITEIGFAAFRDCHRLQLIDFSPNLAEFSPNMFSTCKLSVLPLNSLPRLSSIGRGACYGNENLGSVVIPASVLQISDGAFSGCVSLSEVHFELPLKLVSIGRESFRDCESLTEFRIVRLVRQIARDFGEGAGLHEISVERDNGYFDTIDGFLVNSARTFIVCYFGDDRDVRIGQSIETVGESSFANCPFLKSVRFETSSRLTEADREVRFSGLPVT